ncbi:MAG: AI-2E family transporter [Microthrixaceae bacterium]|nr:AI-2E family transporter [Microthrixaceae bacterium]
MNESGPASESRVVSGEDTPQVPESGGDGPGAGLVLRMGDGQRLPRWVWRLIFAVAISVAVFDASLSILGRLTSLIGMVVVALFLSFAIEPAVGRMARRFGMRRGLGTFLCFLGVLAVAVLFVFVMAELVISQVQDLIDKAPDYIDQVSDWANRTFGLDINTGEVNDLIKDYQSDIASVATEVGGRALSLTGSVVGLVFQAFTVLLFAFYMTAEGPTMRRNFCSVLPEEHQRTVLYLWELSIAKTGGWLYSRLLLAGLSATFTWAFLSIMGVPSPLALALWVGLVSQFIPAIGTYLAGALPVLIALLNDPVDALWVVGFIVVYQQVENYFFSPKITAQTMDLHPAVAFGSAIAGGMLAGPIGAVLALPAAGVIQAFVSTFLERHDVVDSQLTELAELRRVEGDLAHTGPRFGRLWHREPDGGAEVGGDTAAGETAGDETAAGDTAGDD